MIGAAAVCSVIAAILALVLPTEALPMRGVLGLAALLCAIIAVQEARPHRRKWRATMRRESMAPDRNDPHRHERAASRSALIQAHQRPGGEGLR